VSRGYAQVALVSVALSAGLGGCAGWAKGERGAVGWLPADRVRTASGSCDHASMSHERIASGSAGP
jgi:hypothetical protein